MVSVSTIDTSKLIKGDKIPKDKLKQTLLNIAVIILVVIVIVVIYKYFIAKDYSRLRTEGFADASTSILTSSLNNTIYETSLRKLYGDNTRLMCGMLPTLGKSVCQINNTPFAIYKFPIHMIKLLDSSILAVFNDGRLYKKDSMASTMWKGPLDNSLPSNIVPMRMILIASDLVTLLGVGYDNILYQKLPDVDTGNINITAKWQQVPNNSDIIYVLYDNETNFLISIDINGKLFIKSSTDITSANVELTTNLKNTPVLRLYYDLNGYMLVLDTNFDLYQFSDLTWKTSVLNTGIGANKSKIQDILYDNDGKLYGLIFNDEAFMVQIMKQANIFFSSNFEPIDSQLTSNIHNDFVMTDQDIIICKSGTINVYLYNIALTNNTDDDDTNIAYQKQIIQSQADLRKFCADRGSVASGDLYDNYDLLSNVSKNDDKITKLQNVIKNLLAYEPNNDRIKEQYPIIA